ncbi:MAG TPA: ABC transporter ATP-binding protein [Actinomycetota bacterium]|nr:ABC transporter ATP-binding protein [Actinomycetota bacterium]
MTAFEARDLVKRYGPTTALDDVAMTVGEGELVGLVGPNGAGKSTLVKIACGLVQPTSGTASVLGAPAGSDAARGALGYLAELFRFPAWLRVREVVELHQELAGSSGGARERHELLDLVGLGDVADRRVGALSKGMQQRLGIAQALAGSPRLLLLDEPTSALDPSGRRVVRDILREVRRRGIAVLLNSHLLGEVELVCDRVAIIVGGRVVAEGAPSELSEPRGVRLVTAAGERVHPAARRDDVPRLVRDAVAAGDDVYEVAALRSTLEDVYLDAVRSGDA